MLNPPGKVIDNIPLSPQGRGTNENIFTA